MKKRKSKFRHITVFDRPYSYDKIAEGHAIHEAVAEGHCNRCGFLKQCESDTSFRPPAFAWCSRRKAEILKAQESSGGPVS